MKISFKLWRYYCYISAILAVLAVLFFIFGMFGLSLGVWERSISFICCFFFFLFGGSVIFVLILENSGFLTFIYNASDKETRLYKIQQKINELIGNE